MEMELAAKMSRSQQRLPHVASEATVCDSTPLASPRQPAYESMKAVADRVSAALLLVATSPLLVAGWLLVRLTSMGPGLYSQTRVGIAGRTFRIYKLRSMYHNIEALTDGVKWSTGKADSRITPVGRILRRLHIDELPQLWNVLIGDMSLVGPRPERPELVPALAEMIPGYRDRLFVLPGLTGLAQIQLPADTDLDSVRRKLVLDKCYVEHAGLWLDARLAVATAFYLLGLSYRLLRKLFALPNPIAIAETLSEVQPAA